MDTAIQIGPRVEEVREIGAQLIQMLGMIPEVSRTPDVARVAFEALTKAVRVSDVTISHNTWNVGPKENVGAPADPNLSFRSYGVEDERR